MTFKTATTLPSGPDPFRPWRAPLRRFAAAVLLTAATLLVAAVPASASKQVIAYFGTESGSGTKGGEFTNPGDVAVNSTGAGGVPAGTIYVVDNGNHRIQRFATDDNGTPADPYDDTYQFVSAWGAGVLTGSTDYEICTVAADCRAGTPSGGNGTAAGNGSLSFAGGVGAIAVGAIAVDQDSGQLFVSDPGNNRISVYAADGAFLRSFGWDVVASGPGQVPGPNEQQRLTVTADAGKFSLVLDGATTGARGAGNREAGSTTVTTVITSSGAFAVGQTVSGLGIAPGTAIAAVGAGTLTLSQPATDSTLNQSVRALLGHDIPFDASPAELEAALNALPAIGGVGGSTTVTGGPGDPAGSSPYLIEFGGTLADRDLPLLVPDRLGFPDRDHGADAQVEPVTEGGAYEVCVAADGDVCRAARPGAAPGQLGEPQAGGILERQIALSTPDGDPDTGTVFLTDPGNRRVASYDLGGTAPSSFGSAANFPGSYPRQVAVDSRGIVYANAGTAALLRYDSEDANGGGVGFLAPILAPGDERQQLIVKAGAGTATLTFGADTTGDLPFNAGAAAIRDALEALPSIGVGNVTVSGGPGNPVGNAPYTITFTGGLAETDVAELTAADGTVPLSGGIGGTSATVTTLEAGHDGPLNRNGTNGGAAGLEIDPDTDDAGPDTDVLYVLSIWNPEVGSVRSEVQQFGPTNQPGLATPPSAVDDTHGDVIGFRFTRGLGLDYATGRLLVSEKADLGGPALGFNAQGVYVLDTAGGVATATLDSVTDLTPTTATINGTVDPNGPPDAGYRIEYSTDGATWTRGPSAVVGRQDDPQPLSAVLDPPGGGLEPGTLYHVRLIASRPFNPDVLATPAELTFASPPGAPIVETTGTPLRTAHTAQLSGRANPRGAATSYHFEYGEAPCDSNPCASTDPVAIGSGSQTRLVAATVSGLEPDTTYHYRLIADNGAPGSPSLGEDRTVTTRGSDDPPEPAEHPGPPGSDRAFEQVSLPDTGGNPVDPTQGAFSVNGDRALYSVSGGTPISQSGSLSSLYFAERSDAGWQTDEILPPRAQWVGQAWTLTASTPDLSTVTATNTIQASLDHPAFWQLRRSSGPDHLFTVEAPQKGQQQGGSAVSEQADRVAALLSGGTLDPAYPAAVATVNLYDLTSGSPQLASLLPGGAVPTCPVSLEGQGNFAPDGSRLFFATEGAPASCAGGDAAPRQLYVRDLLAGATELVSAPTVSGPACRARLIRTTPGAAFFSTQSRLAPDDSAPAACVGGTDPPDVDVYRYQFDTGDLDCVTCVVPGLDADVVASAQATSAESIAVSDDGSRLYFQSPHRLLAGAPATGDGGGSVYRLDVATGDLAWVAGPGASVGGTSPLTPDGLVVLIRSQGAALDPVGGSDNGGVAQYYRYDDSDRSLVCVSCPPDGSPATAATSDIGGGANRVADDGDLAFATPTSLLPADQNTPPPGQDPARGTDVYEWRDGRLLLVTDGLTDWPLLGAPSFRGISPSGRDLFFLAAAQLTPDALDAYQRLYDARIGGGFEFPQPPEPCPLELCQGEPSPVPVDPGSGSSTNTGPGNQGKDRTPQSTARKCRKGRKLKKGKCVKRKKGKKGKGKK